MARSIANVRACLPVIESAIAFGSKLLRQDCCPSAHDNGAKWKDLPAEFGSKSAVHRWFQKWVQDGTFALLMAEAGEVVHEKRGFKLYECFIDGTFAKAKQGGEGIGCTRVGKGVKIMVLVDANGLPVAACSETAQCHEGHLMQELFQFMITDQKPQRLIGDKAYESDKLDAEMAQAGVEMIAPHRGGRRPENRTQDGRPLRRYRRRWKVESTIAWASELPSTLHSLGEIDHFVPRLSKFVGAKTGDSSAETFVLRSGRLFADHEGE